MIKIPLSHGCRVADAKPRPILNLSSGRSIIEPRPSIFRRWRSGL